MTESPEGRNRYGLAHALKTEIKLATFVAPTRSERAIERKLVWDIAQDAIAERVMARLRGKFRITWRGSDDEGDDAREPE